MSITFDGWPWTRFTPEELATFIASVREELEVQLQNRPTDPADFNTWARAVATLHEALAVLEAPPRERDYAIRRARVGAYLDRHRHQQMPTKTSAATSKNLAPPIPDEPKPARKPGHPTGLLRPPVVVSVFYEELAGRLGSYRLPATEEQMRDLANRMEPGVSDFLEDWQAYLADRWVHRPDLGPDPTATLIRLLQPYVARERRRKAGGVLALAITAEAFTIGERTVQDYVKTAERTSREERILRRIWRGTLDP